MVAVVIAVVVDYSNSVDLDLDSTVVDLAGSTVVDLAGSTVVGLVGSIVALGSIVVADFVVDLVVDVVVVVVVVLGSSPIKKRKFESFQLSRK